MTHPTFAHITNWEKQTIFPPLPKNHAEMIADKVQQLADALNRSNFGEVETTKTIKTYNRQRFAVFGSIAYELQNVTSPEITGHIALRAAVLDGEAYHSAPDEGASGTLHWFYSTTTPKFAEAGWFLIWLNSSWIYTRELKLSPIEIADNIEAEVDTGLTPISGNNNKPQYQ